MTISVAAVVIVGMLSLWLWSPQRTASNENERPFYLTHGELKRLEGDAARGNCLAAYRVAQYHLYGSLNLVDAEKYFRLAAKCPNPEALVGLITVLRSPAHDTEVDQLLFELTKLDAKRGDEARQEVALRRAERQ